MRSLRVLQELDDLLLASAAALGAIPSLDVPTGLTSWWETSPPEVRTEGAGRVIRLHALAMHAARRGELFNALDGWFAATERTIDPCFRRAAETLACGEADVGDRDSLIGALMSSERLMTSSTAWITVSRARIRMYRLEAQDAQDAERIAALRRESPSALRALENLADFAASNLQRWRLVGERADLATLRDVAKDPDNFGPMAALVLRIADALRPLRAAARGIAADARPTALDWQDPRSNARARCLFSAQGETGSSDSPFLIRLFDVDGEPTRVFDGQSANWLGTTTTIDSGRAVFAPAELRESVSPVDVLQRAGALFIGGVLWTPRFVTLASESETTDDIDVTDDMD